MPEETVPVPSSEATLRKNWTSEDAHEVGLPSPEALNFMMAVADKLVGSSLCTPDLMVFSGPPDLAKEMGIRGIIKANAMSKMLAGRELGIPPMESLRTLHVVKGKIFISYEKLLAIMMSRGYTLNWLQSDAQGAKLQVTHPKGLLGPNGYTAEFNATKAKLAGLLGSDQYIKRPDVMFRARCSSDAYRVTGAGPTLYTYEEEAEVAGTLSIAQEKQEEKTTLSAFNPGRQGKSKKEAPPPAAPQPEVDTTHVVRLSQQMDAMTSYGIYLVADGKMTLVPGHSNYSKEANAIVSAQSFAASEPEHTFAVLEHWSQKEVFRTQPAPEMFTPRNALYVALGCTKKEEFDAYAKATGLDQLTGDEERAFCLLAAKLLDAKGIIHLHEKHAMSYSDILVIAQNDHGGTISGATRDWLTLEIQAMDDEFHAAETVLKDTLFK